MPHPYFTHASHPRVLAHRGLVTRAMAERGIAENTRAAFSEARRVGAEYIESDCHLTSDGTVVLFHDVNLARVAGDPRPLAAVTADELAVLMQDRGGLLTLEDALVEFPDTRFNIDVKADAAAEAAGRIIAPHAGRVLLTSFSDGRRRRAIAAARRVPGSQAPATSAGRATLLRVLLAVALRARRGLARVLRDIDALQIPERQGIVRVLTPRLVEMAHEAGVEVHVWTVNEPARMHRLVALGVDGIVTDRADTALAVLRAAP